MATFYSKVTGNWEDGANWSTTSHTGSAGSSPGTAGVDYPGTGDTAIISAGHTITVTTDMSDLATAVTLQCDAPGTNNGTLSFSPTNTTGLKFTMGTITSGATFNVRAGTRTSPINRGNTCTLVTASNLSNSNGTIVFECWGKHREHANSDVYCDILTSNANRNDTIISLNGDINPDLAANDWLWFVQNETSLTTPAKAELVQVDSFNSGTNQVTLKTPLKYNYTTADCLVFKAAQYFVNTELTSDHSSGADYVVADDLYPSGTGGGSFLVQQTNESPKANAGYFTYSSYVSGTKTLTAGSSSATAFNKGSTLLCDDFNVNLNVTTSGKYIGATSLGAFHKNVFSYTGLNEWKSINTGVKGQAIFNSNMFGVLSLNNLTITGYKVMAYGLGMGYKSTSVNGDRDVLTGSSGYNFIRSILARSSDGSGAIVGQLRNGYFEDCILMAGVGILDDVRQSLFRNCFLGNITEKTMPAISKINGCDFQDCGFFNVTSTSRQCFNLVQCEHNIFSNIKMGENSQGKVLPNGVSFRLREAMNVQLFNGIKFASGEPDPVFGFLDNATDQTAMFKFAMVGLETNKFSNFTPGGSAKQDNSTYRSSSPSIKFTHTDVNHPVWFDIPVFLNSGSKTISIYTNPSTGSWGDNPQMILLAEYQADQCCKYNQDLSYLAKAVQSVLTTGSYTILNLTTTIPADGIYVIRLWARNGSGTVNWDDFAVS